MVAGVEAVTLAVAIAKLALVAPAGTVTLAGTVAAVALPRRATKLDILKAIATT